METGIPLGMKRKCSSASQIKSSKRKRLPEYNRNILDLSDCTLLHVLQFLDATSLYQLGETCIRFNYLVQDESLWIHVEGRSQPNNIDKSMFCWQNVHNKTKHLLLAGNQRSEVVLSVEHIISSDKLNNLTVLALEHQCIKYCKLNEFPSTLQELSLKKSFIPRYLQFFRFSETSMLNLKTLILDHCQWLQADSLVSICKYPKLEILSLYMCKKLTEDDISSISLVGKFGFKSLKVVDLRFTGLGDLFIKTFYANLNIQIIYFQCFSTTYYLERLKRKLDIINGTKMQERSYMSDDEANNDTCKHSLGRRFDAIRLQQYNTQTIKDDSMIVFNRLKKTGSNRMRPKSYLYAYPYDECTCGFLDKSPDTYDSVRQDLSSEDEIDDNQPPCLRDCCQKEDILKDYSRKLKCDSTSSSESGDENSWDTKCLQYRLKCEIKKQRLNRHRKEGGNIYFMLPIRIHLCNKLVFDSCTNPEWNRLQSSPKNRMQKWIYIREPRNDYEIAMLEHTDKYARMRTNRRREALNTDCNCRSSTEGVIVITRNSDGTMSHYSSRSEPAVISGDMGVKNSQLTDTLEYLISKMSECIERLSLSEHPSNEAMIVVNEILHAFDICLKKEEFLPLFNDLEFVRQLCITFYKLSKIIKHNINNVLTYHYMCFEQLLKQLEKDSDSSTRKNHFKCFFGNLLYSEGGSLNLDENSADQYFMEKCEAKQSTTDDKWNLPGPSGLKSDNCKRRIKKRWHKGKDDSDSESSVDSSDFHKNGSDKKTHEEQNGVEKCNVRKVLSPHIVKSKRKYQILNKDSDSDEDLENSNVVKYLVYKRHFDINNSEPPVVVRRDPMEFENIIIQIIAPQAERDIPTNIKELSLRGYPHVTDKTLMLLKEMDLDLLDVTGTNVTRLGTQQFMMYNPRCRLIHETACVCRPKLHF